jgi:hypothetical protein
MNVMRRNGMTTRMRIVLLAQVAAGAHVHYCAGDGVWCVTATPLGMLYARLPRPTRGRKP